MVDFNNDTLITAMSEEWFLMNYSTADFAELDILLKLQKQTLCKEVLSEVFLKDEEVRKEYFKVFTKDELTVITANDMLKTKAEYVDQAASINWDDIPFFELVLTNLGSGIDSLKGYSS